MMQRVLIPLILALTILFQGCGGNPKYYNTCTEAFIEIYGEVLGPTPLVGSEVCTVKFSDELIIYAFISPLHNKLITCEIKEKDGKFRVLEYWYLQIPTNSLPNQIVKDGFQTAYPDNRTTLLYQWVATDCLSEERDEPYQYKDFTFLNPMREEVRITLVYYEVKVNY